MSIWDLLVMVCTLGISVSTLPTIFSKQQPPLATSLGFAICIAGIAVGLGMSGLILGSAANFLAALLWTAVALRSYHVNR